MHTPGLKVVAPSNPVDAKGLLSEAIRDNNPVIYFESKPLYRSSRDHVPEGEVLVELGKAAVPRRGDDLTVVSYGSMTREALAAAETLAEEGIAATVVDLRTLKPLDTDTVLAEAARTGKVIVTHAANRTAGVGAEVAALIAEEVFESLDGPIVRLGATDTPVPFSPPLEDAYRPNAGKIAEAARKLAAY